MLSFCRSDRGTPVVDRRVLCDPVRLTAGFDLPLLSIRLLVDVGVKAGVKEELVVGEKM